jgi:glutamine amidotransferase
MMIAVVNYGLGNLHSVQKAINFVGGNAEVTDDPDTIRRASKVVLPGVGAFADGMEGLASRGLGSVLRDVVDADIPVLGICLGMQLLFEEGQEQGIHQGLGFLRGKVVAFQSSGIKIPQIGWNQLEFSRGSELMGDVIDGSYVYFNHGYYCIPADRDEIIAMTDYGGNYASAVQRGNIFGVQFHPEKSQRIGLKIMKNFVEL